MGNEQRMIGAKESVAELLGELPHDGYTETVQWAEKFLGAATEFAAAVYEPEFNREFQRLPKDSYEEFRQSLRFLNHELRRLGLGIVSPSNGKAAVLRSGATDRKRTRGYCWLESLDSDKDGSYARIAREDYGNFTLIGLPAREEPLSKRWVDRIGPPSRGGEPSGPGR